MTINNADQNLDKKFGDLGFELIGDFSIIFGDLR